MNKEDEQIVAEALCGRRYKPGVVGYLMKTDNPKDYRDAHSVLAALRAATPQPSESEPTKAQLLAALNADLAVARKQASPAWEYPPSQTLDDWSEQTKDRMRAALMAAARECE